jgi:Ca-activated chloride channel family protein
VDTASYANVRRFLNQGQRPPADAVRIEELVNYFAYEYPQPGNDAPFSVTTEVAPCPWNAEHTLALIGLQGRRLEGESLPPRNLVFLIDVSGSMQHPQKLPLVKAALSMLAGHLTARDRVAIVVYAGASGLVLPSTRGDDREAILGAIADLEAGGSTNGGAGLRLAYRVAQEHLATGGVNRVVLATDGDFNIGVTNQGDLVRLIEEERERGVSLSVLGFGMGNYKDSTLEKLADKGNGNYAYIDTLQEAQKVLVTDAGGTLVTIAKDVKLQVEFNPQTVTAYRLVGYENRRLEDQDFNDDKKDAGEIGAGHSVTALYEIVPAGVPIDLPGIDPLKYQRNAASGSHGDELMTVKVRYKAPDGDRSRLLEYPVAAASREAASPAFGFASAVAEFGMLLRRSPFKGTASYAAAAERARRFRGTDVHGHRAELIRLMGIAQDLARPSTQ